MKDSGENQDPDAYSCSDAEIPGEEIPASLPVEGVPSQLPPDSQPLFDSHHSGSTETSGPVVAAEASPPPQVPAPALPALPEPAVRDEGASGIKFWVGRLFCEG